VWQAQIRSHENPSRLRAGLITHVETIGIRGDPQGAFLWKNRFFRFLT
jgi:hypothetical protein